MEIHVPMEVVIGSGTTEYTELDFYNGSKALEGTSELLAILSNTILNEDVVTKVPSIEGISSVFRNSYEGSFGQRFLLKITGVKQQERFNRIGEKAFFDLLSYYLSRPFMTEHEFKSARAKKISLIDFKDHYLPLMKRLHGPLVKIHKPIEEQGYSVKIKKKRMLLINYNASSLENLNIEKADEVRVNITASITRFNRLTGTGRLILDEESESVSFEPSSMWRDFPAAQKKVLSRNLDANTDSKIFKSILLEVTAIRNYLGEIKKYSLHRIIMDA